jgi:hypothetical protein
MRVLNIFIFGIFIFGIGNVLGVEGVSPGSYEVVYEEGLEREFVFDFVVDEVRDLRVMGNLAGYLELDKKKISGREKVVATLKFPLVVEESDLNFGNNNIWIIAGDVSAIVKVKVPYPEKYVGLELGVPNVNVGGDVEVRMKVLNLGSEDLVVRSFFEVYSDDEVLDSFEFESSFLGASKSLDFERVLDSKNYSSGDYLVVARVEYGDKIARAENVFRVGEFGVRILNYTREVYDDIDRFEIEIESLWNGRMNEVYFEARVVAGYDEEGKVLIQEVNGFDSTIVPLGAWEKKRLVGFFDSRGLEGDISLNVDVHYSANHASGISSRVVEVRVVRDSLWWIWVCLGLFFLVIIYFMFFRE